jgi:hypothetical protein
MSHTKDIAQTMRILYVKRRLMSFAAADSVCLSVVSVSYENCISIVGVMLAERQTKKNRR